jgi:predicted nucleotidyltransferase component of viral defense system
MKEQYEGQVALLIDVLPFVAQADVFALKGGTAINFFHLDCPRLSVDIDLHYLPLNNREQALADIKANMETIAAGIENAYTDTQVRVDGRTCNAVVARRGTQIKIEPNSIIRGKLLPIENKRLSPYLEEKYGRTLSFPCVAKHELYAGKLCAALQRQHPRDLFDMLLFLRENDLSVEFMDAFLVYLISQGKPIYEELNPNIKDVEALYHNQFMGMPAEKVALEHLTAVQASLSGQVLAALGDRHRQFLLGFKQGNPDWSLLPFNGVKALPAVRWKQINLDNMDSPKRQ